MDLGSPVGPRHLVRLLGTWRARPGPAYAALADGVRLLVLDGRLPPGSRLPAERDLARALAVSRTTVTAAYDRLRTAGFLMSRRGAGSWTAVPDVAGLHGARPADLRDPRRAGAAAPAGDHAGMLDLACAAPAAPNGLAAVARRAVDDLPAHLGGHGYDPVGLPALREAVAARFAARGLPTVPDQVLVTSGALAGLDLVLRLLTGPTDRVLVEAPTYPNALDAVDRCGARPVPVGMSPWGWDLAALETALRQAAPRVAYVIPDFHNPTGHRMPAEQRAALAGAARRTGTLLVVDESCAELAFPGTPPLPPLGADDPDGRVVTLGSTSKAFWGGLRIGWVRAAPSVIRRLAALRATADLGSPVLDQLVARRLLEDADALLAPRRAALRDQRDALLAALAERLPQWRTTRPEGGVSVWARLPEPDADALVLAAAARGVAIAGGGRFGPDGTLERFLRLPFTQPADVLVEAVDRLAAAAADVRARPPRVRPERWAGLVT